MCREAQKEGSLAEKKLLRLESTREHELSDLRAQLDESRTGLREQVVAKDAKITALVEELGNSQALLHDREHELSQVGCTQHPAPPSACNQAALHRPKARKHAHDGSTALERAASCSLCNWLQAFIVLEFICASFMCQMLLSGWMT